MAQIFHPRWNLLSRLSILGAATGALGLVVLAYLFNRSPYVTKVDVVREQPIAFGHEHHVRGLGIDCRYCHTSVEDGAFAGMPPTYTCMSCHSQVWTEAPMLQPVRESLANNEPIRWGKVHDLPDYVYFDHSIHVNKGVGCVSCHGRVDEMPLAWKVESMTMDWCLDCHRNPEKHLRPEYAIFDLAWSPRTDPLVPESSQTELGLRLKQHYDIPESEFLTSCSVCHR
jgi:hypothetical protein